VTLLGAALLAMLMMGLCFLGGMVGLSRLVSIPVTRARLGSGPALLKRSIGGVEYELGALPLLAYVQFETPAPAEVGELPPSAFDEASASRRVCVVLGTLVISALPALVWLGPVDGAAHVATGIVQVVHGAIPWSGEGERLIEAAARLPFETRWAVLLTKLVAFNLLPSPATTFGGLLPRSFRESKLGFAVRLLTALLGLGWLVQLAAWLAS